MGVTQRVLGQAAGNTGNRRVSLENYEDGIEPDDLAAAQQLQIEQQTALEDLDQIGGEIIEDQQEGDLLSEAVDTYPQVVEMIEDDIENNGGVSTESAKYLNFILNRAGLEGIINVSVEDFADNTRRLNATRVSLEGIKETLRNWWENLLNWFKKMREKLKKWWIKNFSAAAALKSRATNLQERAKKITTSNAKEKKLTFNRLQSTLFVNGKFPGAQLPAELKKLSDVGQTLFNDWQQEGIKSAEKILDVVSTAQLDAAGIAKFATDLQSAIQTEVTFKPAGFNNVTGTDVPDDYAKNNDARYNVSRTAELPGQKAIYLKQLGNNANQGGGGEGLAKLQSSVDWLSTRVFKLDNVVKKPKEDGDTQIDTLTPTSIIEICGEIETFSTIIENYQRNFKAQETANDNIDKFKKIADQVPDDNERDVVQAQNLLKKIPNPLRDMINEPVTQFAGHFMRVANTALQVCERSLAQY
jgi:hypothetical protein